MEKLEDTAVPDWSWGPGLAFPSSGFSYCGLHPDNVIMIKKYGFGH